MKIAFGQFDLPGFLRVKNLLGGAAVLFVVMSVMTVVVILAQQFQEANDSTAEVTSFAPRGLLESTSPTNFVVRFSKDLIPDDSLNILFADVPLKIEPPMAGLGKWTDNNVLTFYPDSAFRPSTDYAVSIKSDRTYLNGNRIAEPRTFNFRTPVFAITRVWTELGVTPEQFKSRLIIHIIFNYPVSPDEFMDNFWTNLPSKLDPMTQERPVRGKRSRDRGDLPWVQEQGPTSHITLVSESFDQKDLNGSFEFVLAKGFGCIGGQIRFSTDYKYTFAIQKPEPLVVQSVNSHGAGPNSRVQIHLSQSVTIDQAREHVSITPAIKYVIDQDYNVISLIGEFKPRETYTVEIKKGLKATNGMELERDFSSVVQIGDLEPRISFVDQGLFLSQKGSRLLEIETVNIDEITVEVEQVYVNNIVYYLNDFGRYYYGEDISGVGRRIFSKDYKLAQTLNVPLRSTVDVGKIVGDTLQGIYNVSVRRKDHRWTYDQRRVMISDLGILARLSDNYLMVWVNTLSATRPVSGATVTLISRNNQTLLEGSTDSRGVAIFENIADRLKGFEPYVITVTKDYDLSYLQFGEALISTAEFDTDGRPFLSKGYEAFIYSDRGVYRPGEIAHLVSVVRGANGSVPEEFPYVVTIKDPQGRDFTSFKLSTKNQALSAIDLNIPSFAKTGGYSIQARIGDGVIGRYEIQVEEFMPDRIKTTISADKESYFAGDEAKISVNGTYLFGPPTSGNTVNGHITLESDYFGYREWSGFNFTNPRIKFAPIQVDLERANLGEDGNYTYTYKISQNLNPPSVLKMLVSATVLEEGGRGVSAYKTVVVNPYPYYLGLRQTFEGYARSGQSAGFEVVAVDALGQPVAGGSVWVKFYQIIYQNILKKDQYGIYRYVSEEEESIIDSTLVTLPSGPAAVTFTPHDYGAYRIVATGEETRHSSSLTFYVPGWGFTPWSMANPERIELSLDKEQYRSGEKAKLLVKAPFEGKLLLTIEREKVLEFKTYDLDSNTAEIVLGVAKEYFPNVYLSATLVKSTTSLERFSPARAFGLIPLKVQREEKAIAVSIEAVDTMKPRQKLDIAIRTNVKKGTMVTVAAVDLGILQLTNFETPDPFEFFYGKKRPALNPYDTYSLVFPDIKILESNLSPAGSAAYDAARKRHLNPINVKRVRPVALWSGIVAADDGLAHVTFDIPQFNGKLVIMVVAVNGERVGSATDEVTVKDNIVVQESLPRFIAPGDRIKTGVIVFNNTGKDAEIDVSLNINGPAKVTSEKIVKLDIPGNGKGTAQFTFEAGDKPGKTIFEIGATDGTERALETVELANRPAQPLLTKHGSGIVRAGSPVRISMPTDWLEGTGDYTLQLSSLPAVRFSHGIQYLLSYPYGCIEQTTSKLFPILYFNDLARFVQPEIFGTKGPDYFIAEGIQKLSGMQLPSGEFAFWPGGSDVNQWGSIYASHFLVEARKAGYQVSDDTYDRMIGALKRIANETFIDISRPPTRIYAAYVLAKAGELDKSTLNVLKDVGVQLYPIYVKFLLAAAIAQTSGVNEALYLIPVEIHPPKIEPESGGRFESDIRNNSILLDVLLDVAPENPSVQALAREISEQLYIGGWYTTQSNSFALMALGKFFRKQETPNYTGALVVGGQRLKTFGVDDVRMVGGELATGEIEISINGTGTCYYFWQSSGVPTERTFTPFTKRLAVERSYLDSDGKPLNLDSIRLGDQIVAKITAQALDKPLEYVVINDLLPSCFEIENPRLQTTGRLAFMPKSSYQPQYMDIRDDRLLLFTNLQPRERLVYYYSIRVISRGEFEIPPVAAECMYDPTIAGASSAGHLRIDDSR